MLCVVLDASGYVVQAVGETFPDCSQYVLVTADYAARSTYWADLAIYLDPTGSAFATLVTACLTAVGVVLGLRAAWDIIRHAGEDA